MHECKLAREEWNTVEYHVIALELVSDRCTSIIDIFYVLSILGADILTNQFALVEFEDEECTAVVPFQCVFRDLVDLEAIRSGDTVKVLWNDKQEYRARFILSGMLVVKC